MIAGALLAAMLMVIPPAADAASVSIKDAKLIEGDSGTMAMKFKVTRTHSRKKVSVDYETAAGSAEPFTDFFGGSGTVKIPPNRRAKRISIDIVGDTLDEPNETFTVLLSRARHARIADGEATGRIVDNDPPPGCFDQAIAAHLDLNTDSLESGCVTSPLDAPPSCASSPGAHQWWAFEIPAGAAATFTATPDPPDDIGVALFTANDAATELDCSDTAGNGGGEVISTTNAGGAPLTVYAQVFAVAPGDEGPYSLRILTASPCFTAAAVISPSGSSGDLTNGCADGTGDAEAACGHTGAHEWWTYTIPANTGVAFTATPAATDDIAIAVFTENSASSQIDFVDLGLTGDPETTSPVNAGPDPLTVYLQVVASAPADEGPYTIGVAPA